MFLFYTPFVILCYVAVHALNTESIVLAYLYQIHTTELE